MGRQLILALNTDIAEKYYRVIALISVNIVPSWDIEGCELDSSLYIICVFYSSRIRTLVAMVTLSFHRLIMGKVEISYLVQLQIFEFSFCRNVN